MSLLLTVPVPLGANSYDVLIGTDAISAGWPRLRAHFPRGRCVIVTDENVASHHLAPLESRFRDSAIAPEAIILPPGETSKSFSTLETLVDRLLDLNVERSETIIALGGGVIGDLTGFAAAITKRGTGFIQIPTTLLSQVDSSVGGKTGINTRQGKNFVGAFHQPRLVIADTSLLASLPPREKLSGYAEIIKAALIGDAAMFERLDAQRANIMTGDALNQAIADAVGFKARIVAEDEKEAGRRALLNLGHTFGHAFEADAPKNAIRHGEAVAAGICLAFDYSAHIGACTIEDAERVRAHMLGVGLPAGPKTLAYRDWNAHSLIARMRDDKKNKDGRITLILARGIGNAYIDPDVDESDLVAFMETSLK